MLGQGQSVAGSFYQKILIIGKILLDNKSRPKKVRICAKIKRRGGRRMSMDSRRMSMDIRRTSMDIKSNRLQFN